MQIKSIGIDLVKTTFHLIALGERSGSTPQEVLPLSYWSTRPICLHR